MAVDQLLIDKLGVPLAKFMAKVWLGEPAGTIAGGLLDIVSSRYAKYAERKKAEARFEDLGMEVAGRLLPLFEAEARPGDLNAEAVVFELQRTLEAELSPALMLRQALNPETIVRALKTARPLPANHYSQAETALYERALSECVRYLVNVASTLPAFDERFAAESLERLGRIEVDVRTTLDVVQRIEARVPDPTDEAARYEADYRQAVIRRLDVLELFGADIPPESKRHALSVAYVSLGLALEGGGDAANRSAESLLADVAAREQRRLLIRGDAGMGKSTLLRWAAIQAAAGARSGGADRPFASDDAARDSARRLAARGRGTDVDHDVPAADWGTFVPFLLRLRDCQDGRLPPFAKWATATVPEIGEPPAGWIQRILEGGRGLVLIDGVDEVATGVRDGLKAEIANYVAQYPRNLFLVSSRPAAIESGWLAGCGFLEAAINPLSGLDRDLFIDRWHAAVQEELARKGQPQDLSDLANGLKRELSANPPIARLATNPLLCAMICALHRDRSQKLPESQSELCEALCHMLLHRRERESGLTAEALPEAYRHLDYEQKRTLMVELAASMVRNNDARIDQAKAASVLAAILPRLPGGRAEDAPEIIRTLVERSGILREPRPGAVEFIHNTFKEFLAADWFVAQRDDGLLVNNALEADWQPVLLFAAATRDPRFASALARRLLDEPAPPANAPSQLRSRQTLALRCGAAAKQLDPELQQTLATLRQTLFPPRTMAEAEAIAATGEVAVDFLRVPQGKAAVRAACIRALRLIGTDRANAVLQSYLGEKNWKVIEELAQAVDPLTIPAVLARLTSDKPLPDAIRRQVADLTPLAGLTGLKKLYLPHTSVSDLTPLAGLTGLQTLDLFGTSVSDLTPLAGLIGLQTLDLSLFMASDLSPLAGLTSLRELCLYVTSVIDLSPLAGLSGLRMLYLSGTSVSDLTPLAGLTGLQTLNLSGTSLSDLTPLAGLTGLQELYLGGTPVSDSDLTPLAGLTGLQTLYLSQTSGGDLRPLAGLPNLTKLVLPDAPREWAGLEELQQRPGLSIEFEKI